MPKTQLKLVPDFESAGKAFWKVDSSEKGEAIYNVILRQRRFTPMDISFLDDASTTGGLFHSTGGSTFVFGTRSRIEGFMCLYISGAASRIGEISMLDGLGGPSVINSKGEIVGRTQLEEYDGYKSYSGAGSVCKISIISVFFQRQGCGTSAIQYLQSARDFELIELEANGPEAVQFFKQLGFVETGLFPEHGEQVGMVWNNPLYPRKSSAE